mmetsp:Transcript_68/g.177  ORF Transcript_68/g.177 Transcript_68/m.177 type:complete len:206 (+) Transcript_68:151-768(+)
MLFWIRVRQPGLAHGRAAFPRGVRGLLQVERALGIRGRGGLGLAAGPRPARREVPEQPGDAPERGGREQAYLVEGRRAHRLPPPHQEDRPREAPALPEEPALQREGRRDDPRRAPRGPTEPGATQLGLPGHGRGAAADQAARPPRRRPEGHAAARARAGASAAPAEGRRAAEAEGRRPPQGGAGARGGEADREAEAVPGWRRGLL